MQSLQIKKMQKIKKKKQILGQTEAQSRGAIIKKSLNVNDSSRRHPRVRFTRHLPASL